jgi:transcriptional regulator with XRE-family HTH domain
MTIGDRIKLLRSKESRKSFCERFKISQSALIRYETGEREPDPSLIAEICSRYQVTTDWLILGVNSESFDFGHKKIVQTESNNPVSTITSDNWLSSLTFDEFDDLWDVYRKATEANRGWVQIELLKRFPEFLDWIKKEGKQYIISKANKLDAKYLDTLHYGVNEKPTL